MENKNPNRHCVYASLDEDIDGDGWEMYRCSSPIAKKELLEDYDLDTAWCLGIICIEYEDGR
jgi:hypothetical protein